MRVNVTIVIGDKRGVCQMIIGGYVNNDPFFELLRGKETPENTAYVNIYIYSKYVGIIDITACGPLKV